MKYFTQKWQIHTLMFFQTLYFFHEMQILQFKLKKIHHKNAKSTTLVLYSNSYNS